MGVIAAVSAILILVAELGDKSQLLILLLATRYKPWHVLVGIGIAALILNILAVVVGSLLGDLIPKAVISTVAGLLFIGFGLFNLFSKQEDEEDLAAEKEHLDAKSALLRLGPIVASFGAFFLAEFGDKTQVLALTIAADPQSALVSATKLFGAQASGWVASMGLGTGDISYVSSAIGVVVGATIGMLLADSLALIFGALLGKKLPQDLIAKASGVLFILFGIATLAPVFLEKIGG